MPKIDKKAAIVNSEKFNFSADSLDNNTNTKTLDL